ncbi:MAG: hypothetical protein AAGH83_00940 [Pseudomonadota bacterium]
MPDARPNADEAIAINLVNPVALRMCLDICAWEFGVLVQSSGWTHITNTKTLIGETLVALGIISFRKAKTDDTVSQTAFASAGEGEEGADVRGWFLNMLGFRCRAVKAAAFGARFARTTAAISVQTPINRRDMRRTGNGYARVRGAQWAIFL